MSPRFALISEGPTDHAVIRAILAGFFDDRNITARPLQPGDSSDSFGGWTALFDYLTTSDFEEAFGFTDFVVIQVDSDVCEEAGFDVLRQESGTTLSPRDLVKRITDRLVAKIGRDVWGRIGNQVIFAIAIDSVECWLLVLHAQKNKRTAYQNCLDRLQRALRDSVKKDSRTYASIAKSFANKKTLTEVSVLNDGLQVFLENLTLLALPSVISAAPVDANEPLQAVQDSGEKDASDTDEANPAV